MSGIALGPYPRADTRDPVTGCAVPGAIHGGGPYGPVALRPVLAGLRHGGAFVPIRPWLAPAAVLAREVFTGACREGGDEDHLKLVLAGKSRRVQREPREHEDDGEGGG